MEQMPDEVPDHQGGHYRGTYSMRPSTQAEKQRSRSRYRVSVIQPRLVSEEGGNSLHKADLLHCPLRKIHLDDIKASDTPDEGGAWVLIQQCPWRSHVRSPFHLHTSQVNI